MRRNKSMKITICIGSACHLKGSREIIKEMQDLVAKNGLGDKVDLNGAFCSGNCVNGVCVTVDGELFSVQPENTKAFFEKEVMGRL
ncbi:MAG: (2Fe-2S) ferredoxin domain-containing protein [Hungatella sp.]|nr:(2Fe-2S) ferredoxin domain-containing protein [Hungatella sp.]